MPEPTAPLLPWARWMVPSEVAVALSAILAAYVAGIGLLRPREARGERLASSQALAFAGGLLSLFVVLTGPLADLAGTFLFSAHDEADSPAGSPPSYPGAAHTRARMA